MIKVKNIPVDFYGKVFYTITRNVGRRMIKEESYAEKRDHVL